MNNNGLRTFENAVAIVTGGASGLGRALAEELAQRGAHVMLADMNGELCEEVARGIRERGGQAFAQAVNVADFPSMESFVQKVVSEHGRVDYLFNNAGISLAGEVRHYELQDWSRVLDVNLRGVVNGVQAVYSLMIEQGFGHIVNTASMAGLLPSPNIVAYVTSKHAVVGLSKSLRIEAEAAGVRVSVLCPGVIRTAILDGGPFGQSIERLRDTPVARTQHMRLMTAEQFAVRALNAVAKNKAIIVIPSWWKAAWWLERVSPAFGFWMGRKLLRHVREFNESGSQPKPSHLHVASS